MTKDFSNDTDFLSEDNPGVKLRNYIKVTYPIAKYNSKNIYDAIDEDFMFDKELSSLIYNSAINHILRRLLKTAKYFLNVSPPVDLDSIQYKNRLRSYFQNNTRFENKVILEFINLLRQCLEVSSHKISEGTRRRILKPSRNRDLHCALCGIEIDYNISDQPTSYTLDHRWPRSLGGVSDDGNLEVTCATCNNSLKGDIIDQSDFHYEHICLHTVNYDDFETLKTHAPRQIGGYELAIFSKTNYRCSVCLKPASTAGKLFIERKNPSDSWHFLNLTAYCSKHKPKYDS